VFFSATISVGGIGKV